MIKTIKISNFKSFKNIDIKLGKYNLLIGCNASGKSNFLQIFKFVHDLTRYGLNNAVTIQGGVEYFRNIRNTDCETFNLEIEWQPERQFYRVLKEEAGKRYQLIIRNVSYGISFRFSKSKITAGSTIEQITLRAQLGISEGRAGRIKSKTEGEIKISMTQGKLKFESWSDEIKEEDIFPPFLKKIAPAYVKEPGRYSSLIHLITLFIPPLAGIANIGIYDFDPKLPKRSVRFSGTKELDEEGSNLAVVLKNIIQDPRKYRSFMNLVRQCLPFIKEFDVEELVDKSSLFKLKEIYFPAKYLPASLVSDGTINIIALIIALYFEDRETVIIEEPERNIHPFLISRVMHMLRDASSKKQIFISSHNPLIVKHVGLDDLLLVTKDEETGTSQILRPSELKEVKDFIKHKVGLDEIFVKGLFGE